MRKGDTMTHFEALTWAVDRIMEASDDDISESGEICDSVAEEGAPVSSGRGGDSAGVSQA